MTAVPDAVRWRSLLGRPAERAVAGTAPGGTPVSVFTKLWHARPVAVRRWDGRRGDLDSFAIDERPADADEKVNETRPCSRKPKRHPWDASGAMAMGDLTREQLVQIVDQLIRCDPADGTRRIGSSICSSSNVLHPRASNLIFFPDHELAPEYERRSLTAEEVVDHALAYKPIELGPATE